MLLRAIIFNRTGEDADYDLVDENLETFMLVRIVYPG
jgi:hypothetical protein